MTSDLFEISHRTIDSPVGPLLLAATPEGLVRVAFAGEGYDAVLDRLTADVGPHAGPAPDLVDDAACQLDEYFTGRRRTFDVPLDLRLARGFRRSVLDRLRAVPFGSTVSYGALAARTGSPRAVRAVGTACATNPLPVVVPCHRVVRHDGEIGGYLGGSDAKRALLALEAA